MELADGATRHLVESRRNPAPGLLSRAFRTPRFDYCVSKTPGDSTDTQLVEGVTMCPCERVLCAPVRGCFHVPLWEGVLVKIKKSQAAATENTDIL